MLKAIRTSLQVTEKLSPRVAAQLAVKLALRPRKYPRKEREVEALERAKRIDMIRAGRRLTAWSWGQGPVVLMAHGWESRASQMASLAEAIADAGFQAVALDVTGHGDSEGSETLFSDFAADLMVLAEQFNGIHAFVGHSAGGVCGVSACHQGFRANRYVTIASPCAPYPAIRAIKKYFAVSQDTIDECQEILAQQFGCDWKTLTTGIAYHAGQGPMLMIADECDKDVSVDEVKASAAAWPGEVQLELTEGLNHRQLMWDQQVKDKVIAFLK